jgi:predicted RNase H-like HicB family nuclease
VSGILIIILSKYYKMKLTITITKGEEFFVSAIKEIPAVLSQGVTIEEAKANVLDALQLYLENIEH